MDEKAPLQKAIDLAGTQAALADRIGVPQQLVSYWLTKSRRGVPGEYCGAIEAATGIKKHELRPDIFEAPEVAA